MSPEVQTRLAVTTTRAVFLTGGAEAQASGVTGTGSLDLPEVTAPGRPETQRDMRQEQCPPGVSLTGCTPRIPRCPQHVEAGHT